MGILPIRGLGRAGLIADLDGASLDPSILTTARNVRFTGDGVSAGVAFRTYRAPGLVTSPVFSYSLIQTGDYDRVLLADLTGKLVALTPTSETDVSPAGQQPSPADVPYTGTSLAGIHYLSRADQVPLRLGRTDLAFAPLTNWNPSWQAAVLRSYRDCLVAMNVTENGVSRPGRIRWSEFAQADTEPATWADDDTTVNSGSNYLAELRSPIVDGLPLGQDFFIYSSNEVWRMQLVGGIQVMAFAPVFADFGLLNTNCVLEVDGQHVCFGLDDIIVHDGVQKKSIAEGRVRRRVYGKINWAGQAHAFVAHDKTHHEVWFCYRSNGDDVYWPQGEYCTEAAVWNYANDTWVFRDLPNVGVACLANAASAVTWADLTASWDQLDRAWGAGEGSTQRSLVFPGLPSATQASPQLLIVDGIGRDNALNLPIYTPFDPDVVVGRRGLNLDAAGADLRTYKRVRALVPMVSADGASIHGRAGGALYPGQDPIWGPERTLRPDKGYKLDLLTGGRHLSWQLRVSGGGAFTLTGLDIDIATKGRR